MIEALRTLCDEVILTLAPLVDATRDPQRLIDVLQDLGWPAQSAPAPLLDVGTAGADMVNTIGSDPEEFSITQRIASIRKLIDAINAIAAAPDAAFPPELEAGAFKATVGRDLIDYSVVDHLLRSRRRMGTLLELAGIIQLTDAPAAGSRQAYLKRSVAWSRAGALLSDPLKGLRDVVGWETATPQLAQLLTHLAGVLESYGLAPSYFDPEGALLTFASGTTPPEDPALGIELALNEALDAPPGFAAGVRLMLREPAVERGPAISLLPYATASTAENIALTDTLSLTVRSNTDFAQGVAVTLAPGQPLKVESGFLNGAISPAQDLEFAIALHPDAGEPERILLGTPEASRLAIRNIRCSAGVQLQSATAPDLFFALDLDDARIVVKPGPDDGDSFLASLLGKDGITANAALGLRLSSKTGLHLKGSADLTAKLPTSIQLGPVNVSAIAVGLLPNAHGLDVEIGADVRGSLGPLDVVADGVGLRLHVGLSDPPAGNLGIADVAVGFKGPSGVGLSVDAHGVLTGGGFLFHDETQGLYAGAMQLSLHEQLTLKAFGLIATRMPDGSPGYSLLIFITAEDFRPLQLGMGFTLLGIGGMLAINRTFDVEVLRQGLKSDTLATLLFPRDPVGNAPALIQSLASAFPARRGSYLLGLLAKIGWFTPTLVLFDLALILEFGGRTRLLALGRVSARLPSADNDLVRLNLDALGVIDFDAETLAIDAVLVDSRLVHKFAITGAGALRAGFGSGPDSTFVLALGGLHPHFAPPANFPSLERLTMALSKGSNPRIVCESYFAITANTLQFGARASLYAAAAGFSVEGDIGYDVLIQLAPLHFIADFDARLQLKRGSSTLFMVEVAGQLEGPRPLRLSGKATFKIWFVHFSVRFDATLIEGDPPPLPPAIDVFGQLSQALLAPENWSTRPLNNAAHGVALRTLPASTGTELRVDPLGQLTLKQQVVPLNTGRDLDTFGGAPISGLRHFSLTASSGATVLENAAVSAPFAPAQYFNMSDDEKLTAPSFEMMQAGCVLGTAATQIDERTTSLIPAPLDYHTIVLDEDAPPAASLTAAAPTTPYTLSPQQLQAFSRSGSVARAALRRVGRARFRNAAAPTPAAIQPRRWALIPRATGRAFSVAPEVRTWSDYQAALKSLNRSTAHWQLVPAHEMEP
ncbi:MAG TPA: DUF6603 domain-containing protein [Povalibacter sp.]|nr:DUF6603 domain-containing protein [Povalibacter sp.]